MTTLINAILCLLSQFAYLVKAGIILVLNLLIVSVSGWLELLALLLPPMPSAFSAPSSGVLGWLNWVVPIGPLAAGLATVISLWVSFLGVRWALRIIRVL